VADRKSAGLTQESIPLVPLARGEDRQSPFREILASRGRQKSSGSLGVARRQNVRNRHPLRDCQLQVLADEGTFDDRRGTFPLEGDLMEPIALPGSQVEAEPNRHLLIDGLASRRDGWARHLLQSQAVLDQSRNGALGPGDLSGIKFQVKLNVRAGEEQDGRGIASKSFIED
jgi:hypothetical protein